MWAAAHGQIAVVEFLLQNVRKMPQKMYMYSYSSSVKSSVKFWYLQPTRCNGRESKKFLNALHIILERESLIIHETVRGQVQQWEQKYCQPCRRSFMEM